LQAHHAFLLSQHLSLLDVYDEQIEAFDARIQAAIEGTKPSGPSDGTEGPDDRTMATVQASAPERAWAAQIIVDARPGIGVRITETVLAELGTDMGRFASAGHAASWAGVAPGQNESAGKRKRARLRDGNRYLRAALVQAAWAAVKKPGSFLAAFYHRLAGRRGKKKAIVAVAHKILVIIYTLLKTGQVYQERGAEALDERQKDRIVHRLERRIAQLGYKVHLEPITAVAA
jgi:transposase